MDNDGKGGDIRLDVAMRLVGVAGKTVWRAQSRIWTVILALLFAVSSPFGVAAVGPPTVVDPTTAVTPYPGPRVQDVKELEQDLQSTDATQAARLLWRFECGPHVADWTAVVQRAWDRRDSASPDATTRDPVVRALMAKCLAEPWSRFRATQPSDLPVIAELRHAILSDNSEEVRAAASGLTHFATAEDVQAMVAIPGRFPNLVRTTVGALSEVCRADAAVGIAKIRETIADAGERAEIDRIGKGLAPTRRLLCRFDVNIVGNPLSAADIEDFWVPSHGGEVLGASAPEIAELLHSSNVEAARKMRLVLRCVPSEQPSIDVVRSAWLSRDSSPADSATKDARVRVDMAVCLAEASAASHAAVDSSVAAELRRAVQSEDLFLRIEGMVGLSRIATPADVQLIVDAAKRGPAIFAHIAAAELRTTCVPGAAEGAENLREWTTSTKVREQIDYEIRSTERVREEICGKAGRETNVH